MRRLLLIGGLSVLTMASTGLPASAAPRLPVHPHPHIAFSTATANAADDGDEGSEEIAEQADQWNEARSSPGIVAPGAYTAAWNQLEALPTTGGRWNDQTAITY